MQNPLTTGEAGLNLIKSFESLKLEAYYDPVGIVTIGYGTIRIGGEKIAPGTVITEDTAIGLLLEELTHFEQIVNQVVLVELNQNQFDALISWVYNLGEGNLKSSTLLRKLNSGDFEGAAAEFPKWNRAGGQVLAGLTRRRLAEQALFVSA